MTRFLRYAGITLRRPCALPAALSVTMTSGNTRCLHRLYSRAVALAASGNPEGGREGNVAQLASEQSTEGSFAVLWVTIPSSTAFSGSPQRVQHPAEHTVVQTVLQGSRSCSVSAPETHRPFFL